MAEAERWVRRNVRTAADAAQVLCAACGSWFELDEGVVSVDVGIGIPLGAGRRVRCPLCTSVVVLGPHRRVKRRVPRTGNGVAELYVADAAERVSTLTRVLHLCLALAILALLARLLVVWLPPLLEGQRERMERRLDSPR